MKLTEVLGGKPVPVPLYPPQIPHGLTRDRTRASAVGAGSDLVMPTGTLQHILR
jgi:hypothetical protein